MEATQQDHENGLALFIQRVHRGRFRDSMLNEKLKGKLRQKLAHFDWLDDRYAVEVSGADATQMARMLRDHGAPATCFVLSEDERLDGDEVPLVEALAAVLAGDSGSLISCVPGRLALYYGEPPDPTRLLQRS